MNNRLRTVVGPFARDRLRGRPRRRPRASPPSSRTFGSRRSARPSIRAPTTRTRASRRATRMPAAPREPHRAARRRERDGPRRERGRVQRPPQPVPDERHLLVRGRPAGLPDRRLQGLRRPLVAVSGQPPRCESLRGSQACGSQTTTCCGTSPTSRAAATPVTRSSCAVRPPRPSPGEEFQVRVRGYPFSGPPAPAAGVNVTGASEPTAADGTTTVTATDPASCGCVPR